MKDSCRITHDGDLLKSRYLFTSRSRHYSYLGDDTMYIYTASPHRQTLILMIWPKRPFTRN